MHFQNLNFFKKTLEKSINITIAKIDRNRAWDENHITLSIIDAVRKNGKTHTIESSGIFLKFEFLKLKGREKQLMAILDLS